MKNSFYESVVRYFSFLIDYYGFEVTSVSPTIVKFTSDKMVIQCSWDSLRSSELEFLIGLKKTEHELLPFQFVLKYLNSAINIQPLIQVVNQEKADVFLERLSKILKDTAPVLLSGDDELMGLIEEKHSKENSEWFKNWQLTNIRNHANELWMKKEYREFIQVFSPVLEQLSPLEMKKLAYAKKRVS